jgi:putative transposase
LIEGLGLSRPRPSVTAIWRKTQRVAIDHGWPPPSYSTTRGILDVLDPAMVTLGHGGPVAFRDRFELVYRRDASRPNAFWQAGHTELDLLILDQARRAVRPSLTVVLDDWGVALLE